MVVLSLVLILILMLALTKVSVPVYIAENHTAEKSGLARLYIHTPHSLFAPLMGHARAH